MSLTRSWRAGRVAGLGSGAACGGLTGHGRVLRTSALVRLRPPAFGHLAAPSTPGRVGRKRPGLRSPRGFGVTLPCAFRGPATAPSGRPGRPAIGRESPPPGASGSAACAGGPPDRPRPRPTGRAGTARPAARPTRSPRPVASCSCSGAQQPVRERPHRVVREQRQHGAGRQLARAPTSTRPRRRATDSACSACLYAAAAGSPRAPTAPPRTRPRRRRPAPARPPAAAHSPHAATPHAPPPPPSTTSRSPSGTTSTASPARAAGRLHARRARPAVPRRRRLARVGRLRRRATPDTRRVEQPAVQPPATARAWSGSPASSIRSTAAPSRCSAS